MQDFREARRRVERERTQESTSKRQARSGTAEPDQREQGEQEQPQAKQELPLVPPNRHHDTGGGADRFRVKGGDNSVQESGREGSAEEREEAAAVLHAYLDARVSKAWNTACFYMSASLVAGLEEFVTHFGKGKEVHGCTQILATFAAAASPAALADSADVDVGSLRVNGDHGFVLYQGADGLRYAMPMVMEGGAWKVAALESGLLE